MPLPCPPGEGGRWRQTPLDSLRRAARDVRRAPGLPDDEVVQRSRDAGEPVAAAGIFVVVGWSFA